MTHTLAGGNIGLEEVDDGLWDVDFSSLKLGRMDGRILRIVKITEVAPLGDRHRRRRFGGHSPRFSSSFPMIEAVNTLWGGREAGVDVEDPRRTTGLRELDFAVRAVQLDTLRTLDSVRRSIPAPLLDLASICRGLPLQFARTP